MDRKDATEALTQFSWERQPEAERLVREMVEEFLKRTPEAKTLADRMRSETGTRFLDWIDYIELPDRPENRSRTAAAGYVEKPEWAYENASCWVQLEGMFPIVSLSKHPAAAEMEVGIKVESVADFAFANEVFLATDAVPLSYSRRLLIQARDAATFYAIERHGHRGMNPPEESEEQPLRMLSSLERFRCRQRDLGDDDGFKRAEGYIDHAIQMLGPDLTCDLFFASEREYWQRRNRAAQFQKARQDRLGLGWANHDHHTYRSSRKHFSRLISLWKKLGFQLRERFYAGAEAGWGAQICEQPNTGIITFNDVDLSPEELMNDFAHEPLPDRHELGTVGLWCALHGESFLQAGMHHLECQFDFDSLKSQMESEAGIKVMKPFTDYPYLRQAFTEGERWPVKEERLTPLVQNGQITPEQAQKFREQGAIGSHLENLERNEGFKGFNQKGVSEIIAKTDPRKNV
ncbi:MAG: hypothetical protein JWN40_4720 [Phycisphaerales bacterium]|nr:hypothetical protein [Phycisphaerales bacterium]